jgi:hypothetical protein
MPGVSLARPILAVLLVMVINITQQAGRGKVAAKAKDVIRPTQIAFRVDDIMAALDAIINAKAQA